LAKKTEEKKMSALTLILIAGILVVSLCSFVYLAMVLVANWRQFESSKGSPFHVTDEGISFGRVAPHHDCFETCMSHFAWSVDEVPPCTLQCKSQGPARKVAVPMATSGA
jgi:hypothetical protein